MDNTIHCNKIIIVLQLDHNVLYTPSVFIVSIVIRTEIYNCNKITSLVVWD